MDLFKEMEATNARIAKSATDKGVADAISEFLQKVIESRGGKPLLMSDTIYGNIISHPDNDERVAVVGAKLENGKVIIYGFYEHFSDELEFRVHDLNVDDAKYLYGAFCSLC